MATSYEIETDENSFINNLKVVLQQDHLHHDNDYITVKERLRQQLNPKLVICRLYSCHLISDKQKQYLQKTGDQFGDIDQSEKLLDIIVEEPCNDKLKSFVTVLREKQEKLYRYIRTIDFSGIHNSMLEHLQNHISNFYESQDFNIIKSVSGEQFELNLNEPQYVVPLSYTVKIIDDATPQNVIDCKYNLVEGKTIEEIVDNLQKSKSSKRLILCTAHAGCGKTVLVHRLVCQWLDKTNQTLKSYKVVFVIKIRNVNVHDSLVEIVGKNKNGPKYLANSTISSGNLDRLLSNKESGSQVLFILDGVDERSIPEGTELHQLMKGQKYPHSKVFITARPEAIILGLINNTYPYCKINISGTTDEGIRKYLKARIKKSTVIQNDWSEEVTNLIAKCEDNMIGFDLLHIPFYLNLAGYAFGDHWGRNLSFKNFSVPTTRSQIFNLFMKILVCRWLERLGRISEAEGLSFDRSPLEAESKVPRDIQMKLFHFGEVSYEFLKEQKYRFSESDLLPHFITFEDVADCGLFCPSSGKTGEKVHHCFTHKQIQEYMAGLFLSHQQMKDIHLSKIIENDRCKPTTFMEKFNGLELVMQFLYGLAPSNFLIKLQDALKGRIAIANRSKRLIINYEAHLCAEAVDDVVLESMRQLLLSSETVKDFTKYSFKASLASVWSLQKKFSSEECMNVLEKWYGIKIWKDDGEWQIKSNIEDASLGCGSSECLNIPALNETLHFFLQPFTFPDVKHLNIQSSDLTDIQAILSIFTHLKSLCIITGLPGHSFDEKLPSLQDKVNLGERNGVSKNNEQDLGETNDGPHVTCYIRPSLQDRRDSQSRNVYHQVSTLKELTIQCCATAECGSDMTYDKFHDPSTSEVGKSHSSICNLPKNSLKKIMQQTALTSLKMNVGSVLTNLAALTEINCRELIELELFNLENAIDLKKTENVVKLICHTPKLKLLSFGNCEFHHPYSEMNPELLGMLLECIRDKLTNLSTLQLYHVLGDSNYDTVCKYLPSITQIRSFGVGWIDIENVAQKVEFANLENLEKLQILYGKRIQKGHVVINRTEKEIKKLVKSANCSIEVEVVKCEFAFS